MKLPIEKLMDRIENPFQLVIVAARRVRQITNKAPKLVDIKCSKDTTTALYEIMQGRISYRQAAPETDEKNGDKPDEKTG